MNMKILESQQETTNIIKDFDLGWPKIFKSSKMNMHPMAYCSWVKTSKNFGHFSQVFGCFLSQG